MRLLRARDLAQTFNNPDPEVKDESMSECGKCFECEVCIKCEKFSPPAQRPTQRPPARIQPPVCRPQQPPLDEQRVRQIVLEILIELGLIPEARKRAKITPSE